MIVEDLPKNCRNEESLSVARAGISRLGAHRAPAESGCDRPKTVGVVAGVTLPDFVAQKDYPSGSVVYTRNTTRTTVPVRQLQADQRPAALASL